MREQAEKLIAVAKELSPTYGPFELFALFLPENALGKWDLLVSSDWSRKNKKAAINLIYEKIRAVYSDSEILMLSRIIVLEKDDAELRAIQSELKIDHGLAELSNFNFMGLAIKHAYLITEGNLHSKAIPA
jgi:hypothetical protein